jgi:multimeric flavodoxin WrbA
MKSAFKILMILGSPHNRNSNTRALVEDFIEELKNEGLQLDHEVISLGRKKVEPCRGCWRCTNERPCPIKDDLEEIKIKMIECDMLIVASPVYTNQVTAQMKAFFDRLFTWCHIFPLLGKYSLSAVTTGNDGQRETAAFLEKMLATFGTFSFGSITSMGGFTPGFFPWRAHGRAKNKKLAKKVASTILKRQLPAKRSIQKKMFRAMKLKMTGIHTVNCKQFGIPDGQPKPNPVRAKLMYTFFRKFKLTEEQLNKWAKILAFELAWWRDRNWLDANSLKQLMEKPIPENFNISSRLLNNQ